MSCRRRWDLNVDHWMVAVRAPPLWRCSHCQLHSSNLRQRLLFCFDFIYSALVSASVLHELWFWNQMEVVKEVCLICFTHVGTPVLFTDPLDLNGSAFCFWSVAKCLPNTDGAQQWIFFLKVENWTERLAMTLLYEFKKKKKKKPRQMYYVFTWYFILSLGAVAAEHVCAACFLWRYFNSSVLF